MAHASAREKAILQMKKMRKMRAKRQLEDNKKRAEMDESEYEALKAKRHEKSLKDQVQTAIWDYQHHQFPVGKYKALEELLELRLQEIMRNQEKAEIEEKQIWAVLNDLRK